MIKLTDQQCEALGVPKGTSIDEQVKPEQIQVLVLYPPEPPRREPNKLEDE